jgi:hypothetical protein
MTNRPKNQPALSELQRKQLMLLVSEALILIRYFGEHGDAMRAAALANAVHNLPALIADNTKFDWDWARHNLAEYEKKHPRSAGGAFVSMLDKIRASGTSAKA